MDSNAHLSPPASQPLTSTSDWPAWAIYLGISWTWCIGMFLPVLLIRDYGNPAFWAFALPNIVGAAAMGWIIRSPEESRAFVAAHYIAVRVFSLATILFHAFFVGWICYIKGDALWPMLACVVMLVWMLPLAHKAVRHGGVLVAVFALLSSIGLGAALVRTIWRIDLTSIVQRRTDTSLAELGGLSLVCILGFMLCPYLDATFHHARQHLSTPRSAKMGFGVGFGVVFAAMIGLTYVYADVINLSATMRGAIGTYIAIHIAVQAAATIALHSSTQQPRWSIGSLFILLIAGLGLAAGGWAADAREGEVIYRMIMGFYALVAPAYVWIVGIRSQQSPTRAQWIVLGVVVAAAAPFYWLAFIEKRMPWVMVGVAIVTLSRFVVRGLRHQGSVETQVAGS